MVKIIIEHLENELCKWILLEYIHLSRFIGRENLIFTNIYRDEWVEALKDYGAVYKESIEELEFKDKSIVLDPRAPKILKPKDLNDREYIIIGGILGSYPPEGRTWRLLSKRLMKYGIPIYSLGPEVLPIDSAGAVAYLISKGLEIDQFTFIDGLEIEIDEYNKLILPFRYPIINGRVFISGDLLKLLKIHPPLEPGEDSFWFK